MKQYKVIALSVGAMNSKIFNSGDIVNEDAFIPGRADELVKLNFLREIESEKQPLGIDDFDVSDIKRNLNNYKIRFSDNASKAELYKLMVLAMK